MAKFDCLFEKSKSNKVVSPLNLTVDNAEINRALSEAEARFPNIFNDDVKGKGARFRD